MKAYSVIDDFSPSAIRLLENAGIEVVINTGERPCEEVLIKLVQEYDILIIGAKEKMTKRVFDSCTRLKILGSLSIGMDHIDSSFKESSSITVVNTPTANVTSVAEHTFGLILALIKKFPDSRISVLNRTGRAGISGRSRDLCGKTIGIIGAGRIASRVISISQAFNLNVLCYTFHPENHMELYERGVRFVGLDELLKQSDIVSIHIALSEKTKNMISSKELALMKTNSVIINTSRREITDLDALLYKINENSSFCVGLDIDIEPDHEILNCKCNNLIITPHIAGVSIDAINRMDPELSTNIISVL